jgi:nitric-oxide synthase, bacterial
MFDFLPLLLESPDYPPTLFELPADVKHTIEFTHDDYPALEALKLKWHCVPALSCVALDLGGMVYPCVPFNGWFMGTEMSRNLLDTQRYNVGPLIAKALGLKITNSSLWVCKLSGLSFLCIIYFLQFFQKKLLFYSIPFFL